MTNPVTGTRLSLAGYQTRAVDGLTGVIARVARYHDEQPGSRREIALQSGVTLLQSPTGSGKTLILGRTLEELRGALSRPVVWFWFAPYAGLVAQTRDALVDQCGSLRVRDVASDREPAGTRDGDVFIQTWGPWRPAIKMPVGCGAYLPANTQLLSPRLFTNNGARAAAVNCDCLGIYVETDY